MASSARRQDDLGRMVDRRSADRPPKWTRFGDSPQGCERDRSPVNPSVRRSHASFAFASARIADRRIGGHVSGHRPRLSGRTLDQSNAWAGQSTFAAELGSTYAQTFTAGRTGDLDRVTIQLYR